MRELSKTRELPTKEDNLCNMPASRPSISDYRRQKRTANMRVPDFVESFCLRKFVPVLEV